MSRDFRLLAPVLFLTLAVAACAASSSPTPGTPTAGHSADSPGHGADVGSADRFGRGRDVRGRGAFPRLHDGAHRSQARHRRRKRRDGGAYRGAVGRSGPRRVGARACRPADQRSADLRPGTPVHADRTRRSAEPRRNACRGEGGDRADQDGSFSCRVRARDYLPSQLATRCQGADRGLALPLGCLPSRTGCGHWTAPPALTTSDEDRR